MKKLLALALIAGLFMPLAAQEKKSLEDDFKMFDKNSDGKVSKEEFLGNAKGERKDKRGMRFDTADKDKDGFLSLEEYKVAFAPVNSAAYSSVRRR